MANPASVLSPATGRPEQIAEQGLRQAARRLGLTGGLSITHWRPNSNRKHKVRQFATLSVDAEPRLVAKVRTDPSDHKVAGEARILNALSRKGVAPAPLATMGEEGFVMWYVPHDDLPNSFAVANAEQRRVLVAATVEAVARFHVSAPQRRTCPRETELEQILGDWRPRTAVERHALANGPHGAMHGDLGPWNIRINRAASALHLIDWEDFRAAGAPILDLLNALLTLTLLVHPDYQSMSGDTLYRKTLVEPGPMPTLLREGLFDYSRRTGVDADLCLALIPTYCRGMLRRFELENRPTDHLFYRPLLEHFALEDVLWITR